MTTGHFVNHKHRSLIILYRKTGLRKSEALKLMREDFSLQPDKLLVNVSFPVEKVIRRKRLDGTFEKIHTGKTVYERLKHSKVTPALPIYLNDKFAEELKDAVLSTPKGQRVFPYSAKTGYNIVRRAFKYPHLFRLSLITWFFMAHPEIGRPQGFSIAEVRSWTGLSLKALDYYIGIVAIDKMGKGITTPMER